MPLSENGGAGTPRFQLPHRVAWALFRQHNGELIAPSAPLIHVV
jgi:hypothetical protein